jgi:hypothetical protein
MARTTDDRVALLIQYDRTFITDLQPFIDDASLIIDNVVAIEPVPADNLLELVERYLAAHLVMVTSGQVSMEKVRSLQVQYGTLLDKGFAITHWGTTAMMLDTTGRLAAFNTRLMQGGIGKQFFWAGTE